jgi:hypothetical protein
MMKFEGWHLTELQFVATLIAGREMLQESDRHPLYEELIREIRNRRVKNELHQMTLAEEYQRKAIEEE